MTRVPPDSDGSCPECCRRVAGAAVGGRPTPSSRTSSRGRAGVKSDTSIDTMDPTWGSTTISIRLLPIGRHWSSGAEIFPGLTPAPGEHIIKKHRYSAFFATDLDLIARMGHHQRDHIWNDHRVCVHATARDAMFNNYKVVFLSDATGSVRLIPTSAKGPCRRGRSVSQAIFIPNMDEKYLEAGSAPNRKWSSGQPPRRDSTRIRFRLDKNYRKVTVSWMELAGYARATGRYDARTGVGAIGAAQPETAASGRRPR